MDEQAWGAQLANELTLAMLVSFAYRGDPASEEKIRVLFSRIGTAAEMTLRTAGKDFMLTPENQEILQHALASLERVRDTALKIEG